MICGRNQRAESAGKVNLKAITEKVVSDEAKASTL